MILDEYVEVNPIGKMIDYYKNLGYEAKHKIPLQVKVKDLPSRSRAKIHILCDYCKKNTKEMEYTSWLVGQKVLQKDACDCCIGLKRKESNLLTYGCEATSQLPEIKEKVKQSNLSHFGSEYYSQTPEWLERKQKTSLEKWGFTCNLQNEQVKEAIRNTNLQKYGHEYGVQSQIVREKIISTVQQKYGVNNILQASEIQKQIKRSNLEKYGCEYAIQSKEVQEKVKQGTRDKFGVDYPMQSKEVRQKKEQTFLSKYNTTSPFGIPEVIEKSMLKRYQNGTAPCSMQQLYIYNLYKQNNNIALNYPVCKSFFVDICFIDEKIACEYDGKGHNLSVILGNITQDEFDKKEIVRNNTIKHEGYKMICIKAHHDLLPFNTVLLEMLDFARNYFSTTNHTWINFDIDAGTYYNAEHKDGEPYNFGELRKIKACDIEKETA